MFVVCFVFFFFEELLLVIFCFYCGRSVLLVFEFWLMGGVII